MVTTQSHAGERYYPVKVGNKSDIINTYYTDYSAVWSAALEEFGVLGIPFSIPLYYYHLKSASREVIVSELELPAFQAEGGYHFIGMPILANSWKEAKGQFCPTAGPKATAKLNYTWG